MKKYILLLLITAISFAQNPTKNASGFFAGSGTMNASAIGQFDSTAKGFLFPRMTSTQRNAISSPATSLVIFNTTTGAYNYYDGSGWTTFGGSGAVDSVNGQTGVVEIDIQSAVNNANTTDTDIIFIDSSPVLERGGFNGVIGATALTDSRNWDFPDINGDVNINTEVSSSSTARYGAVYGATGTITFTDPTGVANKGYIVHVIGGTSTIGGVGYTTGALVYRYYNGSSWISKDYGAGGSSAWGSITGTLSAQTDLQTALNLKADLASPTFTGTPNAPTQSANDNTTKIATTAYADAKVADDLTASTTVAPSKTAVNGGLALKTDKTTWVDYSATSTIVGWGSFTTKQLNYKIVDDMVFIDFYIAGTSNDPVTTFTLPMNIAETSYSFNCNVQNNGVVATVVGRAQSASGSNIITFFRDGTAAAFTGSGPKFIRGQMYFKI